MYDLLPGGFLPIGPTVQLADTDTPQQERRTFETAAVRWREAAGYVEIILLCYAALQYENYR